MVQGKNPKIDESWYALNGNGESAFDKPAYVDYYKFLCPNREEVYNFLSELYTAVAAVDEVDGIHLDYIRFPDVILARGLWDKYGLVMDREYPEYDYCYCDKCVNDFKNISGIDIKGVDDPSTIQEWKQFRYDLITKMVNRLAEDVHKEGKEINASRAAALLSWAAHHRGDRLGGLIFGDRTHRELKPRLGRQAALRFLHELAEHPDWGTRHIVGDANDEAPLRQAMSSLRRVARPGSLVVVVSDFLGFSRASQSYLSSVARHNEVLAVFLNDPLERRLPPPGRYRLVADTDELAIDTFSKAAREEYRTAFEKRAAELETFCQRYGIHLLPLSTEDDPVTALQTALGRRTH